MKDKRIELLRDEPVSKAVIKMSMPAIIGLLGRLSQQVYPKGLLL